MQSFTYTDYAIYAIYRSLSTAKRLFGQPSGKGDAPLYINAVWLYG